MTWLGPGTALQQQIMKNANTCNVVELTIPNISIGEGLTILETRAHMGAVVTAAVALLLSSSHLEFRVFDVGIQGFCDCIPFTDCIL